MFNRYSRKDIQLLLNVISMFSKKNKKLEKKNEELQAKVKDLKFSLSVKADDFTDDEFKEDDDDFGTLASEASEISRYR